VCRGGTFVAIGANQLPAGATINALIIAINGFATLTRQ
jgi:hypothetical protein